MSACVIGRGEGSRGQPGAACVDGGRVLQAREGRGAERRAWQVPRLLGLPEAQAYAECVWSRREQELPDTKVIWANSIATHGMIARIEGCCLGFALSHEEQNQLFSHRIRGFGVASHREPFSASPPMEHENGLWPFSRCNRIVIGVKAYERSSLCIPRRLPLP